LRGLPDRCHDRRDTDLAGMLVAAGFGV